MLVALGLLVSLGRMAVVPTPSMAVDFSPDGHRIAFSTATGLHIVDSDGTNLQNVATAPVGSNPLWSPDGKLILFIEKQPDGGELEVLDASSGEVTSIGVGYSPPFAWREDSKWFAAVRREPDGNPVVVWWDRSEKGVTLRIRLPFPDIGTRMVWIPDTNSVALTGGDSTGLDVYTLEAGEVRQISRTSDVVGLAISPDGKRLRWARKGPNLRLVLLTLYDFDLNARSVVRVPFPERVARINPDVKHAPTALESAQISPTLDRFLLTALSVPPPTPAELALLSNSSFGAPGRPAEHGPRGFRVWYLLPMDGIDVRVLNRISAQATLPRSLVSAWSQDGTRLALLSWQNGVISLRAGASDGSDMKTIYMERSRN